MDAADEAAIASGRFGGTHSARPLAVRDAVTSHGINSGEQELAVERPDTETDVHADDGTDKAENDGSHSTAERDASNGTDEPADEEAELSYGLLTLGCCDVDELGRFEDGELTDATTYVLGTDVLFGSASYWASRPAVFGLRLEEATATLRPVSSDGELELTVRLPLFIDWMRSYASSR